MISHFVIPFMIAVFLAINMGGSGTGPAFSAAYGANIISKTTIFGLFGIMVFLGALFAGAETTKTLGGDLLKPELLTYNMVSIILFSVTISLLIANLWGIPQSTSQSTVLAVSAPAIYFSSFNSNKLFVEILPTWFILPILAFVICLFIGKYIYKPIRKTGITLSKEVNENKYLHGLIILMSCYVAFSIGANNVANAAGPLLTMTVNELKITDEKHISLILLMTIFIVAPNFGLGSSIFGHKIVQKTGKEIVLFGKIEAVIIAFISASLLLWASMSKGIPTSLVQLNVGAILGIGVAKLGFKNIFRRTEVNKFFAMWIIAPIIAFALSMLLTWAADAFGYL